MVKYTLRKFFRKGVGYLKNIFYLWFMDQCRELEDQIIDLRFALKESKDKELIYLDILNNIDSSLIDLFKREKENERLNFNETIDYRDCLVGLQKSLREYKRVYNVNF
jgi:hypothetical protein